MALFQHPRTRARAALTQYRHRTEIREALDAFADDASRVLFCDLLKYHTHGGAFSRVAQDRQRYESLEAWMAATLPSEALPYPIESATGETLRLWRVDHDGPIASSSTAAKYGLYWAFASDQYQFRRGGVRIAPDPGDVVIDAGTYLGETAVRFAFDVGPEGRVLAFDPSAAHARLAQRERSVATGSAIASASSPPAWRNRATSRAWTPSPRRPPDAPLGGGRRGPPDAG